MLKLLNLLLLKLMQNERFYQKAVADITIQLIQKNFLGQFQIFKDFYYQLDNIPFELFEYAIKSLRDYGYVRSLVTRNYTLKQRDWAPEN